MREHGNRGVMALFTVEEICEVLSVRPPAGVTPQDLKQRIRRVVTDSRLVRKGDLFIAFQGERFDAHTFVPKVLAQGRSVPSCRRTIACRRRRNVPAYPCCSG